MDHPPNPANESAVLLGRLREVEGLGTVEELDQLPFGVIKVDRQGVVLAYNQAESRLAGLTPTDCVGHNFFTDVAPCTNVESFAARFHRGIAEGRLRDTFPFTFSFPSGEVLVAVTFHYQGDQEFAWIFVDRAGPSD